MILTPELTEANKSLREGGESHRFFYPSDTNPQNLEETVLRLKLHKHVWLSQWIEIGKN